MKKFLKWLIPCLVACFMVVGLVQTASFTFAIEEGQTEETVGDLGTDLGDENLNDNSGSDDENITEDSGEGETEVSEESDVNSYTLPSTEDEEEFVDPEPAVISPLESGKDAPVVPDHEKTITKSKGTDQYQLNLNIKGSSTTEYYKKKVDVLLVIDISASMKDQISTGDRTSRINALKSAIVGNNGEDGLADSILNNNEIDAQMAVVTYARNADYVQSWTKNLEVFENTVSSITLASSSPLDSNSGTNSTAGLIKAKEVLQKVANDGAEKYVIFLTDGAPNFYIGSDEAISGIDIEKEGTTLSPSNITGYGDFYYGTDNNVYRKTNNKTFKAEDPTTAEPTFKPYYPDYLGVTDVDSDGNIIEDTSLGWHWNRRKQEWQYGKYVETYDQYKYDESTVPHQGNNSFSILGAMYSTICAKLIATSIGEDNFYSIGYGSEATNSNNVCYQYLYNMPGEFIQANKSSELVNFFNKIVAEAMTYEISSVTINDVLSEYVELPSETATSDIVLSVKNAKNETIDVDKLGIKLDVTIGKDGKTISANLLKTDGTPYTLNKDFIYTISIPIQPSQAAYNYYSKNLNYPDEDNDKNKGFYSNASNGVNISYKYKEKEYTNPYTETPVVQVTMNSIEISKEVTGSYGDKTKKFNFELELKDENENPVTGNFGSISENNVSKNVSFTNGIYKFSLSNGEKLKIENLPKNFTYEVVETPYSNYTTTYNEQDKPSGTFDLSKPEVSVKVVNEAKNIAVTGITDNTPKGLGLIGSIVVEIAAIAFVLKKKRQLKM